MNKKAFTLVELLVVIAIIGLLASISIISLNNARAKARDAKRVADIKQTTTALELFFNDAGRYPTDQEWSSGSLSYNNQTYLSTIPSAPNPPDGTCDTGTNQFSYTQDNNGESYTLTFCTGASINSLPAGTLCANPGGVAACGGGGGFSCGDSVSYGGESYPTVQIDTQCWLAKNLNVGTRVDSAGSAPCVDVYPNNGLWSCQLNDNQTEKYCYSNDDNYCTTDGGLYEWAEAMALPSQCNYSNYNCDGINCTSQEYPDSYTNGGCTFPDPTVTGRQGLCPTGFHIPSDDEWTALDTYLSSDPGTKLKAVSWDGDNSSGFTALPVGYRNVGGWSSFRGDVTYLWSSVPRPSHPEGAWVYYLYSSDPEFFRTDSYRAYGYSVRCLQD